MNEVSAALSSSRLTAEDHLEVNELYHERGWTDGLPIIPPTPELVARFVEASGRRPGDVVGEMSERRSRVTTEKLAINAVMAGCLSEYMPVLVAAIGAIADPAFKFNHLASLGSPWPLVIVNGPITKAIGLHSGGYLFGPGHRANSTIARAISLVLANCAQARSDGIQRGQWGHPGRFMAVIAENEETSWTPLHVQRGLNAEQSAVTVVSTYPNMPSHVTTVLVTPERMLDAACHAINGFSGAQWIRGMYTLMISPHHVEIFVANGWSKDDVRAYVRANTRSTVADLKYRGSWGTPIDDLSAETQRIEPGDDDRFVYLFKDNGDAEPFLHARGDVVGRDNDVMVVVAGGNAGHRLALAHPYSTSFNPVTRAIG